MGRYIDKKIVIQNLTHLGGQVAVFYLLPKYGESRCVRQSAKFAIKTYELSRIFGADIMQLHQKSGKTYKNVYCLRSLPTVL